MKSQARASSSPPSQGEAVHRSDDRLGHLLDEEHDPLPLEAELMPLIGGHGGHLLDIRPGHEGLFPGTGDNHRFHRVIQVQFVEGALQFPQHLAVEGIKGPGTVDGQGSDTVHRGNKQIFEFHKNS